jgi:DNA repair protein RadD
MILDYGGNIERHGPVDQIKPKRKSSGGSGSEDGSPIEPTPKMKTCPQCRTIMVATSTMCPDCGFEFKAPEVKKKIDSESSDKSILSEVKDVVLERYDVKEVVYTVHTKRNEPYAPRTMRVTYVIGDVLSFSEWICVEHDGFAREKAVRWWYARSSLPMPTNADEAVKLANDGHLAFSEKIVVKNDGSKFPSIVDYELGEIPIKELLVVTEDDDVPF